MASTVYLIPSLLHEEGMRSIPTYITDIVKQCTVLFVENERTTRRFLKKLDTDIVIDNYEWFTMTNDNPNMDSFKKKIKEEKTIGIISEAGCPGIADPGQLLVKTAQEMQVPVRPLVGPSSILLALMASGMNGQQFRFAGYLPIDNPERIRVAKDLEAESKKMNCTQLFIETPYRNNQLIETLIGCCHPDTRLCIAVDITGKDESIITRTIAEWAKNKPDIHKRPAIFLLLASR